MRRGIWNIADWVSPVAVGPEPWMMFSQARSICRSSRANTILTWIALSLAGHSAGGQLALWLAAQQKMPLLGVTSLAGVCDLRRAWELKLSDNVVEQFLGGTPKQVPKHYDLASPIELLPMKTPQRLLHGTADANVPFEMSERFARKSKNAKLIKLEGAGHFELIDPRSREWPTVLKGITEW